jgi:hypothetical protein
VDPLWENAPAVSPYIYTLNNPINFTDPTGEWPDLPSMASLKASYNDAKTSAQKYVTTATTQVQKTYSEVKATASKTYTEYEKKAVSTYNQVKKQAVSTAIALEKKAIAAKETAVQFEKNNRKAIIEIVGNAGKITQNIGNSIALGGYVGAAVGSGVAGVGAAPGLVVAAVGNATSLAGSAIEGSAQIYDLMANGKSGSDLAVNAGFIVLDRAIDVGAKKLGVPDIGISIKDAKTVLNETQTGAVILKETIGQNATAAEMITNKAMDK